MYLALYFFLLAIVLILIVKRPAIAFGYMLCIFALEQWFQSKEVYFVTNTSFINLSSGVLVVLGVVASFIKKGGLFSDIPVISNFILVLYLYAFVSAFWSPVFDVSVANIRSSLPYIVLSVFIAPLVIKDKADFNAIFKFIMLFGFALLILLLFFTDWGYRTITLAGNFGQLKTNPLAIANFSGYVFIVSMLASGATKIKYLKWLVGIICLVISVKTGSRGQFVFMVLASLLFTPLSKPEFKAKNIFPILLGTCILLAVSYWAMSEFSGTDTRWSAKKMDSDFGNRLEAAAGLLAVWIRSPLSILFGLGSSASFDEHIFGFYVHIVPLEILGEEGLIGSCIYLAILIMSYKAIRRMIKITKGDRDNRAILATMSALIVFELFLSLKQGSFLGSVYLFSLIAALSRYELFLTDRYRLYKR